MLNNCAGCGACVNICPCNAITLKENEMKERVAFVDNTKCVDCGLCEQVCPTKNISVNRLPISVDAIYPNENYYLEYCSTIGIATMLSREIILNGGYVCGAAFDNNNVLRHRITNKLEDLELFKGSKYIKSEIINVYKDVEMLLKQGSSLLFIGTPCQIAGIINYLDIKKINRDRLYSVDLICHGTPPSAYLKEHLNNLKFKDVDKIEFRGKKDFNLTLYNKGKMIYSRACSEDLYFMAFSRRISYNSYCYKCAYAQDCRVGDLTIGDYWGLNRQKFSINYKGKIAGVLVNTDKGDYLLKKIIKYINIVKTDIDDIKKGNETLNHPTKVNKERENFMVYYPKYGFKKSLYKIGLHKIEWKGKLRRWILYLPKKILGR